MGENARKSSISDGKGKKKKEGKKRRASVQQEAEVPANNAPEGCAPMMISMKNMEKYELKIGDGMKDTLPYKFFELEPVLEEIRSIGFYSEFNDFRAPLEKYKGEQILIVADPEEKYGQNWFICLTEEAKEREFGIIEEKRMKLEAEAKAIQDEIDRKKAEEDAILNAVYEDKPIVPGKYTSATSEETISEVFDSMIHPERPLIRLSISRKRREFGAPCKFTDRTADQNGIFEFRQHKDPNFELKRRTVDAAVQGSASWTDVWLPLSPWSKAECQARKKDQGGDEVDNNESETQIEVAEHVDDINELSPEERIKYEMMPYSAEVPKFNTMGTQTVNFRKINKINQYEPITLDSKESDEGANQKELVEFLKECTSIVEAALQHNETVDVFADEFGKLADGEPIVGTHDENAIKELRTFTDLVYSKQQQIPALNWHPRVRNVVAVSCTRRISFEERVEQSGITKVAYVLIWNFSDLIHPQLVLECPFECTSFSFCPDQPHLIAGGCITGQVVLWDVSAAQQQLLQQQSKKATKTGKGRKGSEPSASEFGATSAASSDDSEVIPPVQPIAVSAVDNSHRRAVANIFWLPDKLEVSHKGHLSIASDNKTHQFISCAGDHQVLFWDARYKDHALKRNARHGFNSTNATESSSGSRQHGESGGNHRGHHAEEELSWLPHFHVSFSRHDGGKLNISQLSLKGLLKSKLEPSAAMKAIRDEAKQQQQEAEGETNPETVVDSKESDNELTNAAIFSCVTDEGEMLYVNWLGNSDENTRSNEGKSSENDKVIWVERDHFGPCVTLCRSPFFPEILLSIGKYSFNIWLEGEKKCLFEAPLSAQHFTCGAWSPTRPGVLAVATNDGYIHVWDLIDQSHRPVAIVSVISSSIDSIQFQKPAQGRAARGHSPLDSTDIGTTDNTDASVDNTVQLVAAGDEHGNLHILEFPRSLRRKLPNETELIKTYWQREIDRLSYLDKRSEAIKQSNAAFKTTNKEDELDQDEHGLVNDGTNNITGATPTATSTVLHKSNDKGEVADEQRRAELEADESRYRELEMYYITQFGVNTKVASVVEPLSKSFKTKKPVVDDCEDDDVQDDHEEETKELVDGDAQLILGQVEAL